VVGIGFKALSGRRMEIRLGEGVGFSFATIAGCVLLHVSFPEYRVHRYTAGGLTGELLGEVSLGLFDYAGTYLICVTTLCLGLIASTPLETDHIFGVGRHASEWIKSGATYLWEGIVSVADSGREAFADESEEWAEEDEYDEEEEYEEEDEYEHEDEEEDELVEAAPKRKRKAKAKPAKANTKKANTKKSKVVEAKAKKSKANSKKASSAPANDLDELGADSEDNIESAGKTIVLDTPSAKPNKSKAPKAPAPAQAEAEPAAEPPAEEGPEIVLPAAEAVGPGKKKAPPRAGELAKRKVKMPKPEPKEKKPAGAGRVEYLKGSYELPPLELFAPPKQEKIEVDKEFVKQQADAIVETLAQFRIKGKVTKIHPGPVITRYEFKPEAGIKVSKIQSLENDLAMALEAIRIRILAPIPGKSTVGLEVPNKTRENVYLQENLADESFGEGGKMILPMVLGNDIVGRAVSIDLAKSPHLLVAGATGSGKSVGVNAMISSLLYSRTPEDLRMILIDPKMLEFGVYQDVPHLLLPVITDAEKANLALRWTVNEMERRYEALSRGRGLQRQASPASGRMGRRAKDARGRGGQGRARHPRRRGRGRGWRHEPRRRHDRIRRSDDDVFRWIRGGAPTGEDALHRGHHRRVRGPDDGCQQGGRGERRSHRGQGSRRRHPPHRGYAASLGRRDHRYDQEQLPLAHRFSGHLRHGLAHDLGPQGRQAVARHGRHALHGPR
jgi:S-DNA-T family DNA segregation ATPase FtsK/SpoIIIE